MNNLFKTRLIHLKYNWIHVIFWLLFPLLSTLLINYLVLAIESDTKIPIAVIQEEDTNRSEALFETIKTTDYLRVVDVEETEALNQLKKNELDAVFVIKSGYERQIERGGRNKLVEAYESDLSLAFIPVTETITSYIQQDAGRSKAFYELSKLNTKYNKETKIDLNEYIKISKEKETSENLLETSLIYSNTNKEEIAEDSLIKPVSIWLISYLLSVFLLFDWVIKESNNFVVNRFPFLRVSYKKYLLYNFVFYSVGVFIVSLISLAILDIKLSILALIAFQFSLNGLIFLISTRFKQTYSYYAFALGIVLLVTVISGLFIPINESISQSIYYDLFNPFSLILQERIFYLGVIITTLMLLIWWTRKEKKDA